MAKSAAPTTIITAGIAISAHGVWLAGTATLNEAFWSLLVSFATWTVSEVALPETVTVRAIFVEGRFVRVAWP